VLVISLAIVPSTGPAILVNTTRCGSSSVIRSVNRWPRKSMSRSKLVSPCRAVTSHNVMLGTKGSALFAFITSPSHTSAWVRPGSPSVLTGSSCET